MADVVLARAKCQGRCLHRAVSQRNCEPPRSAVHQRVSAVCRSQVDGLSLQPTRESGLHQSAHRRNRLGADTCCLHLHRRLFHARGPSAVTFHTRQVVKRPEIQFARGNRGQIFADDAVVGGGGGLLNVRAAIRRRRADVEHQHRPSRRVSLDLVEEPTDDPQLVRHRERLPPPNPPHRHRLCVVCRFTLLGIVSPQTSQSGCLRDCIARSRFDDGTVLGHVP